MCLLWREGTSTKSCREVAGAWRSIFILSFFTGLLHVSTYNGGISAIPPLKGTNQRSRVFQVALVRRLLILESCFSLAQFYSFNFWSGKKLQTPVHNFQFILVSSLQMFFSVGFFFWCVLQLSLDPCYLFAPESSSSCMFQHVTPSTVSHMERLNSWADLMKWSVGRWEREREIISDMNLSLAAMFKEVWSSWPPNGVRAGQWRGRQLL